MGHASSGLNAENAVYINVTQARGVDNEHAYFKGDATNQNDDLKAAFNGVFNGTVGVGVGLGGLDVSVGDPLEPPPQFDNSVKSIGVAMNFVKWMAK